MHQSRKPGANRLLPRQSFQRGSDADTRALHHVGVDPGRFNVGMAEQVLDRADIRP
jgi:hypothetical protein